MNAGRHRKFEEALVALMHLEPQKADADHPGAEQLIAYVDGVLSETEAEQIRNHLVDCRRCSLTVADLATFPDIEPDHEQYRSTADEEEDWVKIVDRAGLPVSDTSPPVAILARVRNARIPAHLVAAGLAIAVFVTLFIGTPNRHNDPDEARVNIHFQTLSPIGSSAPRSGQATRVTLPADMESYLLFLPISDFRDFDDYALKIFDQVDSARLEQQGLRRTVDGGFTIELLRRSLPNGRYRLTVYGIEESNPRQIASFDFELEQL